MDASPGSQSRKGMGFWSWYCRSCRTDGNRSAIYFSGEPFLFLVQIISLSIFTEAGMMWTQRHHIGVMKIIGCCLFMLDFSDCGCQVSTIIVIRRYLDIGRFFFWQKAYIIIIVKTSKVPISQIFFWPSRPFLKKKLLNAIFLNQLHRKSLVLNCWTTRKQQDLPPSSFYPSRFHHNQRTH